VRFYGNQSVTAIGSFMGAWSAFYDNRTLNERIAGQREITYIKNEVRSFIKRDAPAYSPDYFLLQVDTICR